MIRFIATNWSVAIAKNELIDLEHDVIKQLDFDLQYISPIPFLERFQRIFNLDQVRRDREAHTHDFLAR